MVAARHPFLARCEECRHVWPLAWLPLAVEHVAKLGKSPCPACGGRRIMIASASDAVAFQETPGRAPCFVEESKS
jgi:predicted RNA-binding Zn-ribbon protein involved in translation (DUF1610 family)